MDGLGVDGGDVAVDGDSPTGAGDTTEGDVGGGGVVPPTIDDDQVITCADVAVLHAHVAGGI